VKAASSDILTALQRVHVETELKTLEKTIHKDKAASKAYEASALREKKLLKKRILSAKKLESQGQEAKEDAKKLRKESAQFAAVAKKTERRSQLEKEEFVDIELPMQKADTLLSHDDAVFRRSELKVARVMTNVTEHPDDKKLQAEVKKMVHTSELAKHKMDEDQSLTTKLEKKVAMMQVNGKHSYEALHDEAARLAKQDAALAEKASSAQDEGEKLLAKASSEIAAVEAAMLRPEYDQTKAKQERSSYKANVAKVELLRKQLGPTVDKVPAEALVATDGAGDDSGSDATSSNAKKPTGDGGTHEAAARDSAAVKSSAGGSVADVAAAGGLEATGGAGLPSDKLDTSSPLASMASSMGSALASAVKSAESKLGRSESSWLAGLFTDHGSWVHGNSAVDGEGPGK
jgi:hypothetical protein